MSFFKTVLDSISPWGARHKDKRSINQINRRLSIETLETKMVMSATVFEAPLDSDLTANALPSVTQQGISTTTVTSSNLSVADQQNSSGVRSRNNIINRFDVNRDGLVTPLDALLPINLLNRARAFVSTSQIDPQVDGYFDVNNDSMVTPLDILQVINFLHAISGPSQPVDMKPLTYAVGNSLTGDMIFVLEGRGFDGLTRGSTPPTVTGVHLNCSQNLDRIWNNPDETCGFVEPFGKYRQALSQPVDNVILQPFYGATVAQEIQAIKNLIDYTLTNPANHDTRFFLYATWGTPIEHGTVLAFYDNWMTHEATLDSLFVPSRSTYALVEAELSRAGYNIPLIPVGHTFVALIDAIRNGTNIELLVVSDNNEQVFRPMVESDFWRDPIHASLTGKYIAGLSAYAALYSKAPKGFDPAIYTWYNVRTGSTLPSDGGVKFIEQVVWENQLLHGG